MSQRPRPIRRLLPALCRAAGLVASLAVATVLAAPAGAQTVTPSVRNPNLPGRDAVVIVGQNPTQPARATLAGTDAELVAKRLLGLGFNVTIIRAGTRPELDTKLREIADRFAPGGDLAMVVLGRSLSTDEDIWIVPGDAPTEIEVRTEKLATEAIRLSDLLRRAARQTPRSVAAVIDECVPLGRQTDCAIGASAQAADTAAELGIVATTRILTPPANGRPLAGRASATEAILAAMTHEGASFLDFYQLLARELDGSNLAPRSSVSLSTSFAFWPSRYFEQLPLACNGVDPAATIDRIRTASLDSVAEDCRAARTTWPFVPAFADKLATVTEQIAAKAAVSGCQAQDKAQDYLRAYPSGRWRADVEQVVATCQRQADADRQAAIKARAAAMMGTVEALIREKAPSAELVKASEKALEVNAGQAAFRALDEVRKEENEEAAWLFARFYDPTVSDPAFKGVARPNAASAAFYYNLWKQYPRHRQALQALCRDPSARAGGGASFQDICNSL